MQYVLPGVGSTGCLFDVIHDPNEEIDLASQLPAKLAELRARFRQIEETVYATPGVRLYTRIELMVAYEQ